MLDQKTYKNMKQGLIISQGMLMNNLQFILNQESLEQDLQKQSHMSWRFTRLIKAQDKTFMINMERQIKYVKIEGKTIHTSHSL